MKRGEAKPLLIHEWSAASYDPTTLTIYDTGARRSYDSGNFDFVANSSTNFEYHDDYILFDGTAESVFVMASSAIEALDLGRSIIVEVDWMTEDTITVGWPAHLIDFGAYAVVANDACAFGVQMHSSYIFFNTKFNSNSWVSTNGVINYSYTLPVNTRMCVGFKWLNDGESISIDYILNDEVLTEYNVVNDVDLSWDRFDSANPIYIGRSCTAGYGYNQPWRFYSMRIYTLDNLD